METETDKIAKFHAFVKKLKKGSLEPLLKELESDKVKEYEVYYDRPKEDWLRRYPDYGDDVYNYLHKKGFIVHIGEANIFKTSKNISFEDLARMLQDLVVQNKQMYGDLVVRNKQLYNAMVPALQILAENTIIPPKMKQHKPSEIHVGIKVNVPKK